MPVSRDSAPYQRKRARDVVSSRRSAFAERRTRFDLAVVDRRAAQLHLHDVGESGLAGKGNSHPVGDAVAREDHTRAANGLLVNGDIDRISRYDMGLLVTRAYPVLHDVLQLKRVVTILCACLLGMSFIVIKNIII